jgi:hypothetical protein
MPLVAIFLSGLIVPHLHFVHQIISRPDARIVKDVAALAMVLIKPPGSKACPTNSGQV